MLAVLGPGCVREHPATTVEVVGTDCVACHRLEYESVSAPLHAGVMPETCNDCHVTDHWRPALGGGHPETAFPIASGAHTGIGCQDCHDLEAGSSTDGANTNCIACHPDADVTPVHEPVGDYRFQADQPNFCLSCHPSGEAARHPENLFPITRGAHRVSCGSCHDASLSSVPSMNVSCIGSGCHTRSETDKDHDEVGGYSWRSDDPDFCRSCHPRGTN